MKIYMATIEYENGTNFYVELTPEALEEQIYRFVQMSWYEIFEIYPGCPADKKEAIEVYFDTRGDEYLIYSYERELRGVEPKTSDLDKLWSEFDVYYYDNDALMDKIEEALKNLPSNKVSNHLNEFNEVTYDGERGCEFLRDLLTELDIDPEDFDAEEL